MSYLRPTSLLLFALFALSSLSKAGSDQIETVKKLLATVEEKAGTLQPGLPAEAVLLNKNMLRRIPEFTTIENGADAVWEQSMQNLDKVAPSDFSKKTLFRAFQDMTPENYVKFLNEAATQCEEKRISRDLLYLAIFPEGKLEGLIDDNYKNKEVISFCERAKRIWVNDPQMVGMFNAILSGETKKGIDDMRKAGALNLPELKLSSATTPNFPTVAALSDSKSVSQTSPNDLPVPSTRAEHTPAVPAERGRPRLPWVAGIAALFIIVVLLLRRRR